MADWWVERFASLQGIPSAEAFGDLSLLAGPTSVALAGIPSAEAFGAPNVIGPGQTIGLAGIPSAEAFGGSVLHPGAVNVGMFGKSSDEAFGSLTVGRGPVTVSPSGIPSAEAFGGLTVSLTKAFLKSAVYMTPNTSTAFGTHAVGDLLMIWAYNGASTTLPSKPSATTQVPSWNIFTNNAGSSGAALFTAGQLATRTDHMSGAWGGTTDVIGFVIGNVDQTNPIGGLIEQVNASNATDIAIPAITLLNTDGSSLILHGAFGAGSYTWNAAPSGYTSLLSNSGAPGVLSKNSTTSDGSTTYTHTSTAQSRNRGFSIEVVAHR